MLPSSGAARAQDLPPAQDQPPAYPTIDVIGTSPLLGSGIDAAKVPNATRVFRSQDLGRRGTASLTGALNDQVGSIDLDQTTGNANQPDLHFRGFTASPVEGTPQGVAVYQDGVRINEAFGDTVNWDLIPDFAIQSGNLTSTNPVFGCNALGGAVGLEMKNGFSGDQTSAEVAGGSFGRQGAVLQAARAWDHLAYYVGGSAENDPGWRRNMPSATRKAYGDLGYRSGESAVHMSVTGADNTMVGAGPTPVPLLQADRRAGLSYPQAIQNQLAFTVLHGTAAVTPALSVQGSLYFRAFNQKLSDGNPTSAQACGAPLDPNTMCSVDDASGVQAPLRDQNGALVPTTAGGLNPGEIDGARTSTVGQGGTVQATWQAPLAGHGNHLVAGLSADRGATKFRTDAELGTFDANGAVHGSGVAMNGGLIHSVALDATDTYGGVYLTDTLDVTAALAMTFSARFNDAAIEMRDQRGGDLSGDHHYHRLNPAAGAAYALAPELTWYGNYAENNRAPTAAELSCADPSQSCTLAGFFVADPDLRQVVARTYETGLRGTLRSGHGGRTRWNFGVFKTDNTDDIIEVASTVAGKGYFQNDGTTRRQGVEAGITYADRAWRLGADYSYVEATFRSALDLNSPDNPAADANGQIHVKKGDVLPGVPKNRLKLGADYELSARWSAGTVVTAVSSQVLKGDESNQTPALGGYTVCNLHSSYRVGDSLQLWTSVDNVFNKQYDTYGTFTDASGVPIPAVQGGVIGKTRTVTPAAPLEAFAGVRYTL